MSRSERDSLKGAGEHVGAGEQEAGGPDCRCENSEWDGRGARPFGRGSGIKAGGRSEPRLPART